MHRRKRPWPQHRNLYSLHEGHDAGDSGHARFGPILIQRGSGEARSSPRPSMQIRGDSAAGDGSGDHMQHGVGHPGRTLGAG